MSNVVVATAYGGPEVLHLTDQPTPEPGAGQVRVDVRAIGVNPIDVKSYSGAFGDDPAALPHRIGSEASGVVAAVGPGVETFAVGDEVIAYRAPGAYAAELVVGEGDLIAKPAGLAFEPAAGLLLAGVTAVHGLRTARVTPADTVLVHGAGGGVGLITVQLAVTDGAVVVATASPAKHELLRGLGAVPVAYGPGLAQRVRAAAPAGVDAALDLIGSDEAVDTSLELVADRTRIVTIAAFERAAEAGIVLIGGGPGADPGTELRKSAREPLATAAAEGALTVFVERTYPLAQAADAHREIAAGHVTGKLILIP